MYYCQTRYFVPEWGRWLNADNVNFLNYDDINGMNLFAYCANNPVMYADPTGEIIISLIITALVGAAISAATSALVQSLTTGKVDPRQVGISAAFGAVTGMLSFWGIGGALGQFFIQGALGVGELYSIAALEGNVANVGIEQVVGTFLFAGALGAIGGRGGTKEFKRVAQIEKDFLKYAGRDIFRYGKSIGATLLNRGGKYIKDFLKPIVINGLVSGGVTAIANIGNYWIQKLYDEFK